MIFNMHTALLLLVLIATPYTVFVAEAVDGTLPETIKMESRRRRCRINVCFAIDGSDNLESWQFRIQRGLVAGVVQSIAKDNNVNVAAVQYGLSNRVISPLTNKTSKFLHELRNSTFTDAAVSFVGAGVVYCQGQLIAGNARRSRMVVLGTGQSDLGGDPAVRAKFFRDDGGKVFAVAVGDADIDMLNALTGDPDNVFKLRNRAGIEEILDDFVKSLCA